jgi:hypothetical protein
MGWATFWAIFPQTHLVTLIMGCCLVHGQKTFYLQSGTKVTIFENCFAEKNGEFYFNCSRLCIKMFLTLVFEKIAIFSAELWLKSPKMVKIADFFRRTLVEIAENRSTNI